MKPIKISIKGLNSFVEEQVVDFERLTSKGLFGIFGPTGSGKSTILDAITFALYGQVARLGRKKGPREFINAQSDVVRVVFVFGINSGEAKTYKIIREASVLRTENDGKIEVKNKASHVKLIDLTDNKVLAEKEGEVAEEINRIIGLEYEDFVKTVVLPQGGFQDFLKMSGTDRRDILQRIFGLEEYGDILWKKIAKAKKAAESELYGLDGALSTLEVLKEEDLKAKEEALKEMGLELKKLKIEHKDINEKYEKVKQVFELRERLDELQEALAKELEKKPKMDALEEKLKKAERADYLDSPIKNYKELGLKRASAGQNLEQKKQAYEIKNAEAIEARKLYFEREEEYNKEFPQLIETQARLKEAEENWKGYLEEEARQKSLEEEGQNYKLSLNQNEELRHQVLEAQKAILKEMEEARLYLKEHKITAGEREALVHALNIYNKTLSLKEQQEMLLERIDFYDKKLSEVESERGELTLDELETKVALKILDDEYEDYRNLPYINQGYYFTQKQLYLDAKVEAEEIGKKQLELSHLEETLLKLKEEGSQLEEKLAELDLEYSDKKAEYEDFMLHQSVELIKSSLHEGDSCPVCQATIGKLIIEADEDAGSAKRQAELKLSLEELEAQKHELARAKAEVVLRLEAKVSAREEIENYLRSRSDVLSQGDYDEKLRLLETENARFQEAIESLESRKKKFEQEAVVISNQLESNEKKAQEYREELSRFINVKGFTEQDLAKLQLELDVILGSGSEDPKSRLDELSARERKLGEIEEKLLHLEGELSEKTAKISQLEAENTEILILVAKIDTSVEEIGSKAKKMRDRLVKLLGEVKDPGSDLLKVEERKALLEKSYHEAKKRNDDLESSRLEALKARDMAENEFSNLSSLHSSSKSELASKMEVYQMEDFAALNEDELELSLGRLIALVESEALSEEARTEMRLRLDISRELVAKKQGEIESIRKVVGDRVVSEDEYRELGLRREEVEANYLAKMDILSKEEKDYEIKKVAFEKASELSLKKKAVSGRYELLKELAKVCEGKVFAEFVALKKLDFVTKMATEILTDITNGGYFLEADENGEFKVRDIKNGGILRDVKTLSGGETFYVSLALALALSRQIQLKGSAPLELFFLDEGFGTLDAELLELVMDTLESLHNESLKIGIISHVEALKQRVPVKLIVTPLMAGEGGSRVRIE